MKITNRLVTTLILAGWANSVPAAPITGAHIVTVNGTEWAQVDRFTNLSWNEIHGVCPGGVCGPGTLRGYDMEGWIWGTTDDVNALFNFYLAAAGVSGGDLLGPGTDDYEEVDSSWALAFYADGWRHTIDTGNSHYTGGLVYDRLDATTAHDPYLVDVLAPGTADRARTTATLPVADSFSAVGGWFYRAPSPSVPVPATLGLLVFALGGLGWMRRKKSETELPWRNRPPNFFGAGNASINRIIFLFLMLFSHFYIPVNGAPLQR